ncbi:MAG: ABC transporter permease [Verrucomicrobia bacterium]|nr:MAG: ABC transporter permease [Verrucomicrobiota bacterium]
MINILTQALGETLLMVFVSALFASTFGLILGLALEVTKPHQILPHSQAHHLLEMIINIGRSIPFIILLVAIIPITRWIVGTSIGTVAAIVPLTIGAIPFTARLIEAALMELPEGLLDAAHAMGLSSLQIITKVFIPEALPGIFNSIIMTLVTLVNYSAMAGTIGGGGLGDVAIRYGYQRFDLKMMLLTVLILVLLVQLIQYAGHYLVKKCNHR